MLVIFFPNGNTAVCDDAQQIPKLQRPWILIFVEWLKSQGVDPVNATYLLPGGQEAQIFETSDPQSDGPKTYNWRIK